MASIETLIGQVSDKTLQERLAREVAELKKRLSWGLVFERHLPENTRVLHAPIRPGTAVWERRSAKPRRFRVLATEAEGEVLHVVPAPQNGPTPSAEPERIARADVLVELDFAEPIYPALTPLDAIRNGPTDRPYHVVIDGENYHAIEALLVAYEGKVDVVYLDPPYNTGNREWSYNNDYIDPNDTFRPSKWLAFMDRRLRLAKRLLKEDGVVVISVDENEHAHLAMLLEQVLPEFNLTSVAIVHNPRGIQGDNFSYTNDFAVFAVREGQKRIARRTLEEADESPLRNWGGQSRRADARNCFYPIFVKDGVVVGFGPVAPDDLHPEAVNEIADDGTITVWPIDGQGEAKWRYARQSVEEIRGQLSARTTGRGARRRWDIFIRKAEGPYRTVWSGPQYDASTHGSQLLSALGVQFDFPKSLYTMREILAATTANRPEAVILDFFAGSGTTLHATMLLNQEDAGRRRCILVTNNELSYQDAANLNGRDCFRGDPEFEAAGVFEKACRPRVKAAITGKRPNGQPVKGSYLDGRPFSEGFPENVEFFRLDYLDPAEIELGMRFAELHPLLWLRAGGIGAREELDPAMSLGLPQRSPYAVLFKPSGLPDLLASLPGRPDIDTVFIVADSADSFAALSSQIEAEFPGRIETVHLYREYLETLRGAIR